MNDITNHNILAIVVILVIIAFPVVMAASGVSIIDSELFDSIATDSPTVITE